MQSFNMIIKNMNKNLLMNRFVTIIDGENFRYLPFIKRVDFLGNHSDTNYVIFVSKSPHILKPYTPFPFYNKINHYLVMDFNTKSVDDSFCVALSNELLKNEISIKIFSNDNFNDRENIITQKKCVIRNNYDKYNFDPIKELNSVNFDKIKSYHCKFN
jgi:hypothetical protein